jgi:hypothetical protein
MLLGREDHRMDVAAWLRGLGLEQYAQLFRDNDIDGEILCGMTTDPEGAGHQFIRPLPQAPQRYHHPGGRASDA